MEVRLKTYVGAIIALIIAIVLSYILISLTAYVQGQAPAVCVSNEVERERIRQHTYEGIDEGFKKHVSLLFDVWVKDATHQPRRAKTGIQNGISAYVRAKADAAAWAPPLC